MKMFLRVVALFFLGTMFAADASANPGGGTGSTPPPRCGTMLPPRNPEGMPEVRIPPLDRTFNIAEDLASIRAEIGRLTRLSESFRGQILALRRELGPGRAHSLENRARIQGVIEDLTNQIEDIGVRRAEAVEEYERVARTQRELQEQNRRGGDGPPDDPPPPAVPALPAPPQQGAVPPSGTPPSADERRAAESALRVFVWLYADNFNQTWSRVRRMFTSPQVRQGTPIHVQGMRVAIPAAFGMLFYYFYFVLSDNSDCCPGSPAGSNVAVVATRGQARTSRRSSCTRNDPPSCPPNASRTPPEEYERLQRADGPIRNYFGKDGYYISYCLSASELGPPPDRPGCALMHWDKEEGIWKREPECG